MKYLNLTEGFNPNNADEEDLIKFESFVFAGGEPHIKIKSKYDGPIDVAVSIRLNSFVDVGLLMIATEALNQIGWLGNSFLFIPYFPGARQDRRMVEGEPLTVTIYADIINSLGYDQVEIFDPHSDVAPALIYNVKVTNNHDLIRECLSDISDSDGRYNPHIISPDAGSNKKIKDVAKYLHELDGQTEISVIKCDKTRDTSTGKISGFEVYADDLDGRDCVIIDDICDGGGTFIGLAEELKKKNAGNLYLIISHGIFSKGMANTKDHLGLMGTFKHIYTTDSFENNIQYCSNLTTIKLSL